MSAARLAILVFLALAACKKAEKQPAEQTRQGAPALPILLDDKLLTERPELGTTPVLLSALAAGAPPIESWMAVEVIDRGGKVSTILAPARNHPGTPPAMTAGKVVQFGLLRDGKLEQMVDDVARVTIKTKSDAGKPMAGGYAHGHGDSGGDGDHGGGDNSADKGVRATPTAELTMEVETAAGTTTFTGDKMAALPEIKAPAGDTETPGWNLVDVLRAAGLENPKVVVLTDEANASLRIEGDDWDPAKAMLYLKLNKSGQIRFRVFRKTGEMWDVAGELRGIKRIKVPAS